jgi:hypothetical protein
MPNNTEQRRSRSLKLPVEDLDFLLRDEMRDIRFALEYAKAELLLRDWGIRSTIIVFGSARTPSPEQAEAAVAAATTDAERAHAQRMLQRSAHYTAARELGRIISERGGAFAPQHRWRDNVVATGGGPGIMEDMIEPADLALFEFADTPEAAWDAMVRRGLKAHAAERG